MKTKIFEVKEEHLKLLRRAYIGWNDMEHGAPSIDPKRPYGDSFVYADIAEILEVRPSYRGDWTDEDYNYMNQMHSETATVLQIILKTGKMETGIYEASEYGQDWKKIS
jgi:hypothetical protein